ncbi:MAG: hypothetical protein AAF938_12705 [Myxococcota bacterium]
MAVWKTSQTTLRIAALSAAGELRETFHELSNVHELSDPALGAVGEGFGLVVHTRCGRRRCILGYALAANGTPSDHRAERRHYPSRPHAPFRVTPQNRPAPGRLWLTRKEREYRTEVVALGLDEGRPAFMEPDRSHARVPLHAGPGTFVEHRLLLDVGETFDLVRLVHLFPRPTDTLEFGGDAIVPRSGYERHDLLLGPYASRIRLRGRARAFVSSGDQGHILVQTRQGLEHVVAEFRDSPRASIVSSEPASEDSLPAAFRERVSMEIEDGQLRFVDVLGNAVGASLAVPDGEVHYVGGDFVVTSSAEGVLTATPIRCRQEG